MLLLLPEEMWARVVAAMILESFGAKCGDPVDGPTRVQNWYPRNMRCE